MLKTVKSYNQLEPNSFIEAFINHPPHNFRISNINLSSITIPAFIARLDLLLTLDESVKSTINKIIRIPFLNKCANKIFTRGVLFVGTTVSEYSIFPPETSFDDLTAKMILRLKKINKSLLIVKDLPLNSPFLNEKENIFSEKLINHLKNNNFLVMSGQALAYLPIPYSSFEEYLATFNSKKRNDFKRKIKAGKTIDIIEYNTSDNFFSDQIVSELYKMYLNVFFNSEVQFDMLTEEYFKSVLQGNSDGKVFVYKKDERILGFNLCFISDNKLLDKYRGCIYPDSLTYCLFFNQFFHNIEYCIKNKLAFYIIGGAAPTVKASLGASFTFTYHAIFVNNPVLRRIFKTFYQLFESDKNTLEAAVGNIS